MRPKRKVNCRMGNLSTNGAGRTPILNEKGRVLLHYCGKCINSIAPSWKGKTLMTEKTPECRRATGKQPSRRKILVKEEEM